MEVEEVPDEIQWIVKSIREIRAVAAAFLPIAARVFSLLSGCQEGTRFGMTQLWRVLGSPGVCRDVGSGGTPVPCRRMPWGMS